MPSRRRNRSDPPVSFFSFQDIILTTAGILILSTLLMVLTSAASPSLEAKAPELADDALLREARLLEDEVASLRDRAEALAGAARLIRDLPKSDLPAELARINRGIAEKQSELKQAEERLRVEVNAAESAAREAANAEAAAKVAEAEAAAATAALRGAEDRPRRFIVGREDRKPLLVEVDDGVVRVGEVADDGRLKLLGQWRGRLAEVEFTKWAGSRDRLREYFVFYVRPEGVVLFESVKDAVKGLRFAVGWEACPRSMELFPRE
jgi:hypothetical protein